MIGILVIGVLVIPIPKINVPFIFDEKMGKRNGKDVEKRRNVNFKIGFGIIKVN